MNKTRMNFTYDPSFPSGHTSSAFNTATFICLTYPKWYVIAPAALWATSVAYSRMYLGVHYPSDVLAGAVLGAGTAYLTYYLNKHYSICRKFKPVKPLGWMN
jgi:undecaprenyl-diphosphatase